jgi:hypothetical protein
MNDLLAMYGLSGCDTVAPYYGIGKAVAFRVLRVQNLSLGVLGNIEAQLKHVVKQSIPLVLACCGDKDTDSANDAKYNLWMMKVGENVVNAPKL